ncbi:winged helix-turn-helix domain-containing protein [Cypionkella aquatica]|uniref:Winged helix-turn-helix domain-containing protein n=1 Tax=Cypionkella aquatica TaxID=1756042 RepID=A0AA37TVM0_9RHOB|nr:hypothetical protein [Cypionkella aquatica]GLS86663.1 winged helix-turn-helix domain-containing protein [Cypionkella aquatica]
MAMRSIRAKNADIQRAWSNVEVLLPEAAANLGMSVDCLQDRAIALGLPQRRTGRREVIRPHQEKEFRLMWRAGVAARQIGAHFDCSYFAVVNTAVRLELEARGAGFRPRMTLSAYCEVRLGVAMRASVAAESVHQKGVVRG